MPRLKIDKASKDQIFQIAYLDKSILSLNPKLKLEPWTKHSKIHTLTRKQEIDDKNQAWNDSLSSSCHKRISTLLEPKKVLPPKISMRNLRNHICFSFLFEICFSSLPKFFAHYPFQICIIVVVVFCRDQHNKQIQLVFYLSFAFKTTIEISK